MAQHNFPIAWITAEIGEGAQQIGCKYGPAALRERLKPYTDQTHWQSVSSDSDTATDKLTVVAEFMPRLAAVVQAAVTRHHFPVVLGGDHSCAIGTWSGIAQAQRAPGAKGSGIGLIWIDAHLDSHTPATSESQAPHGMPLAALLGYGDTRLTHLYGWAGKVDAQHAVVIGARSYESGEADLLKRLNVRVMEIAEVKVRGMEACMREAIAIASGARTGYGVTLDLDALDPREAPGVGSPVAHGLALTDVLAGLRLIADDTRLLGFEMTEYNPALDDAALTTASACEALLDAALGKRLVRYQHGQK